MTTKVKISRYKQEKIFEIFWQDIDATKASEILSVNRNTINSWYNKFREAIVKNEESEIQEKGVFELDESYFGPTRIKGKRGRGAGGKTIVFGLLKRDGKVYTEIIPDAKAQSIITKGLPQLRVKIYK